MNEYQEAYYKRFQKLAGPVFDMLIDTSVQHQEYFPEEGPCLIVANHRSDIDPFVIIMNTKRPINWMAASYLWNIPGMKSFLKGMGAFPVSKYRSDIRNALDRAADLLEHGEAVGIFPEGWDYISENQFDWSVGEFQSGFARVAIETQAPVLPIALLGLDEVRLPQPFPPFIRKIFEFPIEMQYIKDRCQYRKLHINIGRPMKPPVADPNDREAVKDFTLRVHDAVEELYNNIPRNIVGFETIQPSPAGPPVVEPDPTPDVDEDLQASTEELSGNI